MSASKVYFTNFRATFTENLLQKLARLVKKAGMLEQIDFKNQYTAIKIHFGEPGNLAYLRPNYSKVIVDLIKEQGGKVFLTDCNTLYVGGRKNALDHLDSAYTNGYNPFTLSLIHISGSTPRQTGSEGDWREAHKGLRPRCWNRRFSVPQGWQSRSPCRIRQMPRRMSIRTVP